MPPFHDVGGDWRVTVKIINTETGKVIGEFPNGTSMETILEEKRKELEYRTVEEMLRCLGGIDHWKFEEDT